MDQVAISHQITKQHKRLLGDQRKSPPLWQFGYIILTRDRPMSALPPKADSCSATANVCFGPIADVMRPPSKADSAGALLVLSGIWRPITCCGRGRPALWTAAPRTLAALRLFDFGLRGFSGRFGRSRLRRTLCHPDV